MILYATLTGLLLLCIAFALFIRKQDQEIKVLKARDAICQRILEGDYQAGLLLKEIV